MTTPKEEAAEAVDDRIESATRKLKALKRDFGMKGANATTIERAIDLMRSIGRTAPPQPSGEVERMREALKPFAKLGALFLDPDNQATKGDDRPVWGYNSIDLTYGDFRRAFAALTNEAKP